MKAADLIAGLFELGAIDGPDGPSWDEVRAACKGVKDGVIQWDEAFAEKYVNPYLATLSDLECGEEVEVAEVLEKMRALDKQYGFIARRISFYVEESGMIDHIWPEGSVGYGAEEILGSASAFMFMIGQEPHKNFNFQVGPKPSRGEAISAAFAKLEETLRDFA